MKGMDFMEKDWLAMDKHMSGVLGGNEDGEFCTHVFSTQNSLIVCLSLFQYYHQRCSVGLFARSGSGGVPSESQGSVSAGASRCRKTIANL
jgi:hypothetical protein